MLGDKVPFHVKNMDDVERALNGPDRASFTNNHITAINIIKSFLQVS